LFLNAHFLDRFVVLTRIQASTLFEANEGNCANRGTFAHPDIAIHIAQWCSADFSIQVSRWVRQLLTTGRVELGNEMNAQQPMADTTQVPIIQLETTLIVNAFWIVL